MNDTGPGPEMRQCMKCGFCMSLCPVYAVDHVESHVARGRNTLIDWVAENTITSDASFQESLKHCLLCRRCETVCPANVPSVENTLLARSDVLDKGALNWGRRWVHARILRHRTLFARLLGLIGRIPLLPASKGSPLRHMADFTSVIVGRRSVPRMKSPFLFESLPHRSYPPRGVQVRGEMAIFPGCAVDFFFSDIGKSMVSVLTDAGYIIVYPRDLTCCGFAIYGVGDFKTARKMAAHNIDALSHFDRVITGCATCGSAIRSYPDWFSMDDPLRKKARDLSGRITHFSTCLTPDTYRPRILREDHISVTWHDPCHLKWHQGISAEPRALLRSLKGITYIEMPDADQCCGLGGSFAISCRETSMAIADKKIASVRKTGADVLVTACPGCIIQLSEACRRNGLSVEVMHISELLHGRKGRRHRPR